MSFTGREDWRLGGLQERERERERESRARQGKEAKRLKNRVVLIYKGPSHG